MIVFFEWREGAIFWRLNKKPQTRRHSQVPIVAIILTDWKQDSYLSFTGHCQKPRNACKTQVFWQRTSWTLDDFAQRDVL